VDRLLAVVDGRNQRPLRPGQGQLFRVLGLRRIRRY
jgi:hypothetical protein